MDTIKIELTTSTRALKRPSVYDGILAMQLGGVAALRILEMLTDEETQHSAGAMIGIVTTAPEFIAMCGALLGMAWQGDDLGVKRGKDLGEYGAEVVRAAEGIGLTLTDIVVAGCILYRDVQARVALDAQALERANFTDRIRVEGS